MTTEKESKGEFLGTWGCGEGLKTLSDSVCKITEDFSNDSESYSNKSESKTILYFKPEEISRVAHQLDQFKVGRYANSRVYSYVRSYSWGGYVWSPLGPVNKWNSGKSAGFEVDGIDITLRSSQRDS